MRRLFVTGLVLLAAGCGSLSTDDWLQRLKNPDVVKRRQAIRELGSRTAEAPKIVPALSQALRDESGYVRHDAAVSLGKFGAEAREAVPALVSALKDKEQNVRKAAGAALRKIDPPAAAKAGLR
jgi:HEAT repeat protein